MVAASGCAPPMPPSPAVSTQRPVARARADVRLPRGDERLVRALQDALRADVDPRARGHLPVHDQARAPRAGGTRPTWPTRPDEVRVRDAARAARPGACGSGPRPCPTARGASRRPPSSRSSRDDHVERLHERAALPGAAVDDEIVGALRHLGVEVVVEHPERGLLDPPLAAPLASPRRAHRPGPCSPVVMLSCTPPGPDRPEGAAFAAPRRAAGRRGEASTPRAATRSLLESSPGQPASSEPSMLARGARSARVSGRIRRSRRSVRPLARCPVRALQLAALALTLATTGCDKVGCFEYETEGSRRGMPLPGRGARLFRKRLVRRRGRVGRQRARVRRRLLLLRHHQARRIRGRLHLARRAHLAASRRRPPRLRRTEPALRTPPRPRTAGLACGAASALVHRARARPARSCRAPGAPRDPAPQAPPRRQEPRAGRPA